MKKQFRRAGALMLALLMLMTAAPRLGGGCAECGRRHADRGDYRGKSRL